MAWIQDSNAVTEQVVDSTFAAARVSHQGAPSSCSFRRPYLTSGNATVNFLAWHLRWDDPDNDAYITYIGHTITAVGTFTTSGEVSGTIVVRTGIPRTDTVTFYGDNNASKRGTLGPWSRFSPVHQGTGSLTYAYQKPIGAVGFWGTTGMPDYTHVLDMSGEAACPLILSQWEAIGLLWSTVVAAGGSYTTALEICWYEMPRRAWR